MHSKPSLTKELFYLALAAVATPLQAVADPTSVIMSTDDARRSAYTMPATGQTADVQRMLPEITPSTTDEARALAGLRIEFAQKMPSAKPQVVVPSTTDEARALAGLRIEEFAAKTPPAKPQEVPRTTDVGADRKLTHLAR